MRQRNKLSFFLTAALCLCTLCCASCGGKNTEGESPKRIRHVTAERKLRIGYSMDTLALERWQRDLDIFMNKSKELGAEVIVQNAGNSVEEQNKQLLYLLEREVSVVVVVAKKRDSLTESIKTLRSRGVDVISYDRLISDADISLYISVNTERVGELMAQQFLSQGVGSRWYLILGPDEDYNMALLQ